MRTKDTLTGVALLLLGVGVLMQWRAASELRARNAVLQQQLLDLTPASQAAAEPQSQLAARDEELTRLQKEAREVHKLRGEIGPLRRSAAETQKLRQEN